MQKLFNVLPAVFLLSMSCQFTGDIHAQNGSADSGTGGSAGRIAVVYDPGGSSFPLKAMNALAEELKTRGYLVEIMTANQELILDQSRFRVLVLGSPIHGAEVMPAVKDFIAVNTDLSIPVFALLTGLFPKFYETYDLPNLTTLLGQSGISLTGAVKIRVGTGKRKMEAAVGGLADAIETALERS